MKWTRWMPWRIHQPSSVWHKVNVVEEEVKFVSNSVPFTGDHSWSKARRNVTEQVSYYIRRRLIVRLGKDLLDCAESTVEVSLKLEDIVLFDSCVVVVENNRIVSVDTNLLFPNKFQTILLFFDVNYHQLSHTDLDSICRWVDSMRAVWWIHRAHSTWICCHPIQFAAVSSSRLTFWAQTTMSQVNFASHWRRVACSWCHFNCTVIIVWSRRHHRAIIIGWLARSLAHDRLNGFLNQSAVWLLCQWGNDCLNVMSCGWSATWLRLHR